MGNLKEIQRELGTSELRSKELELYDLLEMDAEGEVDDLDASTQDILMN